MEHNKSWSSQSRICLLEEHDCASMQDATIAHQLDFWLYDGDAIRAMFKPEMCMHLHIVHMSLQ